MVDSPQPTTQFLSLEESADVDKALLSSHEKFLTRLTISSLRLLKHIAEDTGIPVEELTHQQIIDWFEKDGKIRREQGVDAAYLKWWVFVQFTPDEAISAIARKSDKVPNNLNQAPSILSKKGLLVQAHTLSPPLLIAQKRSQLPLPSEGEAEISSMTLVIT